MNDLVTISFETILMVYAGIKLAISVWVCKHEFQYPIWNKDGIQISRGIHHKAQSLLRNWAINPEWGLLKIIAFLPVFVATGKRFIHTFLPWRVQKTPPFCKKCNDKGKVPASDGFWNSDYEQSERFLFIFGGGKWQECDCKKSPRELPDCTCYVCLDQGHIGKGRPCPHCERKNWSVCEKCAARFISPKETHYKWCKKCYVHEGVKSLHGVRVLQDVHVHGNHDHTMAKKTVQATKTEYDDETDFCSLKVADYPYAHLGVHDVFCGDSNNTSCVAGRGSGKNDIYGPHWCEKTPYNVCLGETIFIDRICNGHRNQSLLGKPLKVLSVNMPFAIVEEKDAGIGVQRYVTSIDLRGCQIVGTKISDTKDKRNSPPLLNPSKLEVGDNFVVFRVHEDSTDGSFRGQAFQVTQSAYLCPETEHTVIDVKRLSFEGNHVHSNPPIVLDCKGLLITSVHDDYICSSKYHCPDLWSA